MLIVEHSEVIFDLVTAVEGIIRFEVTFKSSKSHQQW
jgi:hypothetical protein